MNGPKPSASIARALLLLRAGAPDKAEAEMTRALHRARLLEDRCAPMARSIAFPLAPAAKNVANLREDTEAVR